MSNDRTETHGTLTDDGWSRFGEWYEEVGQFEVAEQQRRIAARIDALAAGTVPDDDINLDDPYDRAALTPEQTFALIERRAAAGDDK